jgi:hypothetical protein
MDMPKPGEAHKKLDGLIGEWSGPETMYPSPWAPAGGKAKARVVNRGILDGFGVVQEYEQRQGRVVTFRGYGIFWFDAAKTQYVMHWWDSMGGVSNEFRGEFAGEVLVLTSPMPNGGAGRVSFDMTKPGRYVFSMETSQDGQAWEMSMDGAYRKAAAPVTATKGTKAAKAAKATKAAKKVATKVTKKTAKKAAKKAKRR